MVTKEDLSDALNNLFGIDVAFDKMTKADLEELVKVFGDPSFLIQLGVKQLRVKAKKEMLDKTLGDLLDKPILEDVINKEGGILGLGILPAILNRGKKTLSKKHQNIE